MVPHPCQTGRVTAVLGNDDQQHHGQCRQGRQQTNANRGDGPATPLHQLLHPRLEHGPTGPKRKRQGQAPKLPEPTSFMPPGRRWRCWNDLQIRFEFSGQLGPETGQLPRAIGQLHVTPACLTKRRPALRVLKQGDAVLRKLFITSREQTSCAIQHGLNEGMAPGTHHGDPAGAEFGGTQTERFIPTRGIHRSNRNIRKSGVTLQTKAAFKDDPIAVTTPVQEIPAVALIGGQRGCSTSGIEISTTENPQLRLWTGTGDLRPDPCEAIKGFEGRDRTDIRKIRWRWTWVRVSWNQDRVGNDAGPLNQAAVTEGVQLRTTDQDPALQGRESLKEALLIATQVVAPGHKRQGVLQ